LIKNTLAQGSLKQRIIRGGYWALGGKIITILLGFFINILLARILSPVDFGVYYLLQTFISISVTIVVLGFDNGIIKFLSEKIAKNEQHELRRIFVNISLTILASSLLYILVLNVGAIKIISKIMDYPEFIDFKLLIFIWLLIASLQRIVTEAFRGLQKINLATIFGGSVRGGIYYYFVFFVGLLIIYLVQDDSALRTVINYTILGIFTSLILSIYFFIFITPKSNKSEHKFNFRKSLKTTFLMFLTSLAVIILSRADIWLVGALNTKEDVALYASAVRFVVLINSSLMIINAFLPPFISELYTKMEFEKLENILRTSALIAGIPAFIFLILLILFSKSILSLIYGDFYTNANTILIILSLGQLMNVISGACGFVLMMTGNQTINFINTLITVIYSLITAFLFNHFWGSTGIAIAFSTAIFFQNVLNILAVKKRLGIYTFISLDFRNLPNIINNLMAK